MWGFDMTGHVPVCPPSSTERVKKGPEPGPGQLSWGCVQLESFRCSFRAVFIEGSGSFQPRFPHTSQTCSADLQPVSSSSFCLPSVLGDPQQTLLPAWEDQSGWSAPQQESSDGCCPEGHCHLQEDRARGRSGPPVPPPPERGLWEKRWHFTIVSPRWRRFKSVLPVQLRSTGAIWSGWKAVSVLSTLRIRTLKGRASRCPMRTPR